MLRLLDHAELTAGMRVHADAGFPCRQWIRPLGGGRKAAKLLTLCAFQPIDSKPSDQLQLTIMRMIRPYALVRYCDDLADMTVWIDTREVPLFCDDETI